MSRDGGCWPTAEQALLLRAILLAQPEAGAAWRQWRAAVDLDLLDAGSVRLLPQLYRRLQRDGVRDPSMGRLRGVYRHAWYANQLRLRDLAALCRALADRGIEAMLLKGAALVTAWYGDPGLRPMDDVDVLVPSGLAAAAAQTLAGLGWRPQVPMTRRHAAAGHAMDFYSAAGQRLDLHWRLLPECCWPGADDAVWERSARAAVRGAPVRVLAPADQLFHLSAHGVRWEPVPPVRWIADATAVLARGDAVDWDTLVAEAARRRMTPPVRDALRYLRQAFGAPVPERVIAALAAAPVTAAERWEYRLRTRPANPLVGRVPEHWLRYRRLRRAGARVGFAAYLQVVLVCDGLGDLARRALLRHRWRRRERRVLARYARGLYRDPTG
jgi:hypothetical protein